MKSCSICAETKSNVFFKKDKRRTDGLASYCKACHNNWSREARIRDPEKFRQKSRERRLAQPERTKEYHKRYLLKNLFGISIEEYQRKFEAQGGRCYICYEPERTIDHRTGKPYLLSVDHNHTTKTVRDLLCRRCNSVLGQIKESPMIAANLLDYAERWEGK